jgi:urea transporter
MHVTLKQLIQIIFKSFGQIILQNKAITGFLLLIGITINSIEMGLAALLSAVIALITALVFKLNKKNIEDGIYGFNAILIGVAVVYFLNNTFYNWVLIILCSIIVVLIQEFFIKLKLNVYTLPFILITWLIYYISININPELLKINLPLDINEVNKFLFPIYSFGQIIFKKNIIPALIFMLALLLNSPILVLNGLIAAIISSVFGYLLNFEAAAYIGIFGYNAVLCAIVFNGYKFSNYAFIVLSSLLTSIVTGLMLKFNFLVLTFPFVIVSIILKQLEAKTMTNLNKIT